MTFTALLLDETDDGVSATITDLDDDRLPEGSVTVDVEWSSLNYKDGMILQGIGRLVRNYPHVPRDRPRRHRRRVGRRAIHARRSGGC